LIGQLIAPGTEKISGTVFAMIDDEILKVGQLAFFDFESSDGLPHPYFVHVEIRLGMDSVAKHSFRSSFCSGLFFLENATRSSER
jgi:hypothetical protein